MLSRTISVILLSSLMVVLSGCSRDASRMDLQNYVEATKDTSPRKITELPKVKPYEAFVYEAQMLRSPFGKPEIEEIVIAVDANIDGLKPDVNRRKEVLESYELDALRMVGTLELNGVISGVVQDVEGMVYRVKVGNFIGRNHGRVDKISEEQIKIIEIVTNGQGGWIERDAEMALLEEE